MLPHDEVHNEIRHTFDPAPPPQKKKKTAFPRLPNLQEPINPHHFKPSAPDPRWRMLIVDPKPPTLNPKLETPNNGYTS